MRNKVIKKIIAVLLVMTIVLPNITTFAEINTIPTDIIQTNSDLTDIDNKIESSLDKNQKVDVVTSVNEVQSKEGVEPKQEVQPSGEVQNNLPKEGQVVSKENKYEVNNEESVATYSVEGQEKYEREEFNLKSDQFDTLNVLKTKTEDNYEIALASADGSYYYSAAVDNIDTAIDTANNLPVQYSGENLVPVVIDNSGVVVYATDAMGKISKHIGGEPYEKFDKVTNLYADSQLTKANNYINHGYVDDVPIIKDAGSSALIQVSGYKGWINKDTSKSEYDMIVYPLNQVTNPSYYYVENGVLKHFISSNLIATTQIGSSIEVGPAPIFMKNGIKYYSYDSKYFYTDLSTLLANLRSNSTSGAVNAGNEFYGYYNTLPFRSKTFLTTAQIDNFINTNTVETSKLRGTGQAFINAQNAYGVNALLMLGVGINESNWGKSIMAQTKNNIFGINAVDSNTGQANEFSSIAACINEFAKNWISRGYSDPSDSRYYGGYLGNKANGANVKYASDPFWGEKASQHVYTIDRYASGSGELIDYNAYQLAVSTVSNEVKKSDGSLIYKIKEFSAEYTAYINTPFVVNNKAIVSSAGVNSYEINPERDTPINSGGTSNKFSGDYRWDVKGYVNSNGVKFINSTNISVKDGIEYQTHIEGYGWQEWKTNGEASGTEGQARRLEAIKINVNNITPGASIEYRTHVQSNGWQDWKRNGELSGTSGESKRLEAIEITLKNAPEYSVQYRVHVEGYGWQEWRANGDIAGTVGQAKRLEAIEIRVVKDSDYKLQYRSHVQDYGWQGFKNNTETSGTVGNAKRLEGIEIKLDGAPANTKISYQVHVEGYGWQGWKENGQIAGTVGEGRRLEAIKIRLENAPGYKIEYRTHVEGYGWQDWKSDGQISGTEGKSRRLEAIEIRIVKK